MWQRDALRMHCLHTHFMPYCLCPAGVSVVEDIDKRREPLPLAAVYFISPCSSSVAQLVADFESKPPYPSVHVFFSSGVTQEAVDRIKRCRVRGVHECRVMAGADLGGGGVFRGIHACRVRGGGVYTHAGFMVGAGLGGGGGWSWLICST